MAKRMPESVTIAIAALVAPYYPNVSPSKLLSALDAIEQEARPRPTKRRLCNVREAGEFLGVHPRTIQRYARAGQLTTIRLSKRKLRYDLNELEILQAEGLNDK